MSLLELLESWCVVRILVLLQRKTLIETNNRTLKCLKWHCSSVRSMKNVAVLTKDGHLPSFSIPTPPDLTAQESPPLRICHPRQKGLLDFWVQVHSYILTHVIIVKYALSILFTTNFNSVCLIQVNQCKTRRYCRSDLGRQETLN